MSLRNTLGIGRLQQSFDLRRRIDRRRGEVVVGGLATMPARLGTFRRAFRSIIRQVDRLYLYLDGHDEVPDIARGDPRIVAVLSRDLPGLRANGKLLGLALDSSPAVHACFDDDLFYCHDYVSHLRGRLAAHGDGVAVGLHAATFRRPFDPATLHRRDRRELIPYTAPLAEDRRTDLLGTGAVMFSPDKLKFDVRNWPFSNMVDLGFAIEAARRGIGLVAAARRRHLVRTLAHGQPDSINMAYRSDNARRNDLHLDLLRLQELGRPAPGQPPHASSAIAMQLSPAAE